MITIPALYRGAAKYNVVGTVVVITPETPCSSTGSSYIISGTTSGFLTSQTTEDTGCGLTETPWIIQVSNFTSSDKDFKELVSDFCGLGS